MFIPRYDQDRTNRSHREIPFIFKFRENTFSSYVLLNFAHKLSIFRFVLYESPLRENVEHELGRLQAT